jgi:hypothetical protein
MAVVNGVEAAAIKANAMSHIQGVVILVVVAADNTLYTTVLQR